MDPTLIVGYGNPLRGDDAAGFLAAEQLGGVITDPGVTVLAVQQITPELAEPVSRAARVIFIDAAVGPEPGQIRERIVRPAVERGAPAFTHHASLEAILAAALALYGHAPEAWLISVGGSDFSYSTEPSPALVQMVDSLAAAVLRLMGELRTFSARAPTCPSR